MRVLAGITALVTIAFFAFCGGSGPSTSSTSGSSDCNWNSRQNVGDGAEQTCHLVVDGDQRTLGLRVPHTFDQANTRMLLVYLHSGGGSVTECHYRADLFPIVDQNGVALACPLGSLNDTGGRLWNLYFCYMNKGVTPCWAGTPPDDSGFIGALIQTIESNLKVDPRYVFLTGFSAGSGMLSRVVTDQGSMVSSIAVVAGSQAVWDSQSGPAYTKNVFPPAPSPVSVLMLRGDQDTGIPVCSQADHSITTLDEDLSYYSSQFHCITQLPNSNPFCPTGRGGPPSGETYKKWSGCANGVEVRAYVLHGATHALYTPAAKADITVPPIPYNTQLGVDFQPGSEEQIVWQWLTSHPK